MQRLPALPAALFLFTVLATTCMVAPAKADGFGQKGQITLSGERLMGVYFDHHDSYQRQPSQSLTLVGIGATFPASIYTTARVGVDGFLTDNLTIGGSFAFLSASTDPGGGATGALFAARVGYALAFNNTFGFWPRGGFSFYSLGDEDGFALTLEALFYASPVEHVAFTFGPLMDLEFAGKHSLERNLSLVSAGITVWF